MSPHDIFTEYLETNHTEGGFGISRELTDEQRATYTDVAANLVEEVFMRMPNRAKTVEITHGQGVMLSELFEQIVIDFSSVSSQNIEHWRKKRIEALERICLMIHSMITTNILLSR